MYNFHLLLTWNTCKWKALPLRFPDPRAAATSKHFCFCFLLPGGSIVHPWHTSPPQLPHLTICPSGCSSVGPCLLGRAGSWAQSSPPVPLGSQAWSPALSSRWESCTLSEGPPEQALGGSNLPSSPDYRTWEKPPAPRQWMLPALCPSLPRQTKFLLGWWRHPECSGSPLTHLCLEEPFLGRRDPAAREKLPNQKLRALLLMLRASAKALHPEVRCWQHRFRGAFFPFLGSMAHEIREPVS